jgi:hypothetical protein
MASNGTLSVAALDADLAELGIRAQRCRDLLHRCLIDLTSIEFRQDVLLERRTVVARITAATTATMQPR